eukprot:3067768-Amphidinium_carterae.1
MFLSLLLYFHCSHKEDGLSDNEIEPETGDDGGGFEALLFGDDPDSPNPAPAIDLDALPAQSSMAHETAGDRVATDPLAEPLAGGGHRKRVVHEDSFRWGGFYFTYSPPEVRPPHGAWSV